jgi:hypothetical protein
MTNIAGGTIISGGNDTILDQSIVPSLPSPSRQKEEDIFESEDQKNLSDEERAIKERLNAGDNHTIFNDDAETILRSLINRKRFQYTLKDMFSYYFPSCVPCRKKSKLKSRDDLLHHYKFKKGQNKLVKKLDVVALVKSIRQLEMIT